MSQIIMPPRPADADKEDLVFLSSGGAIRRIGLPIGVELKAEILRALVRAQDNGWVTLVDIVIGMHAGLQKNGPMMTRVFRITDAGMRRITEIKRRRQIDASVQ